MYGKLDFLHAAFGVVPDKLDCFESTLDSPAFDIEGLDSSFLLNLVTQEDFYLKNGNIANGSRKAKRIHEETFLNMEIRAPELVEQRRIGAFLDRLDSLITLHQRKYDKLCVLKKSMLDKMFPKGGSLYPEIRFAGFTDPWEQRKLGEIAAFGGGHTPSMSDPDNYEGGNVLWVTSQDVKSYYLDGTTTQITEKGAKELTLYPMGALVMVTRSGILRHTLPVAELCKPSTVNQDIRVILPQEDKCCGKWLLQFFISRNKELLLEFGKTGTTVESVDFSKMKDMILRMPSLSEQRQIGLYFARLDNLITLHQRKYDKLCVLKKSMLDKMFPKGGSLYPEIRFAGFTDPWEQRKLGEIAAFGGGHTPSMSDPDNYEGGNVLWVTSQDVKSYYLDGTTTQITEKGAKELTLYPMGALVMVTRSGILRHTLPVAELCKPSTVNQDIRVILPQEDKCCGKWLLQFFISRNKELLLEFGKTGTTVESVDFSKMKDMILRMPSLSEQRQIGLYFARLDNLITLHQRKLELLRNIKKSMLDKMFV